MRVRDFRFSFSDLKVDLLGLISRAVVMALLLLLPLLLNGCKSSVTQTAQVINSDDLIFSTATLPAGVAGQFYSAVTSARGGVTPYQYIISEGTLPPGLEINSGSGAISGTVSESANGDYSFTVQVIDQSRKQTRQPYMIRISTRVQIATAVLPVAQVLVPYSTDLIAVGGSGQYTFSADGLPAGFSISSTGTITGLSATSGASSVAITVTDSNGLIAQKSFEFLVSSPLVFATASVPRGAAGLPYTPTSLAATGGIAPFTWRIISGALPAGLSMTSAGVITGTPTSGANVRNSPLSVTIEVRDRSMQSASQNLAFITSIPPRVSADISHRLRPGGVSVPYSDQLQWTGGVGQVTFSVPSSSICGTNLVTTGVPGVCLNTQTGALSGTPTTPGDFSVLFTATDSQGFSTTSAGKRIRISNGTGLTDLRTSGSIENIISASFNTDIWDWRQWELVRGSFTAAGAQREVAGLWAWDGGSGRVFISSTTGDGVFSSLISAALVGQQLNDLAVADLDGDSRDDLIVSTQQGMIYIYLSTVGGPGFANLPTMTPIQINVVAAGLPTGNYGLAAGNLNGLDGGAAIPDFAFTAFGSNRVYGVFWCRGLASITVGGATQSCTASGVAGQGFYFGNSAATASGAGGWLVSGNGLNQPLYISIGNMDTALNSGNTTNDLVVSNWAAANVMIFRNATGLGGEAGLEGSFTQAPIATSTSPGSLANPTRTRLIDMNGDGILDLVTGWWTGPGVTVNYYRGGVAAGDGSTFSLQRILNGSSQAGGGMPYLDVADVDSDGDLDIVAAATADGDPAWRNTLAVWYSNGSPPVGGSTTFTRVLHTVPRYIMGLRVLDAYTADGLGRPDIVFMTAWNGPVRLNVLPNTGGTSTNSFEQGTPLYSLPPLQNGVTFSRPMVGDLNNDGCADVLGKIGSSVSYSLQIKSGSTCTGSFALQDNSPPTGDNGIWAELGRSVVMADFNGDGALDYASANWNGGAAGTVTLVFGKGDGTFNTTLAQFTANPNCNVANQGALSLDVADFNRDSIPDLVVGTGCDAGAQAYVFFGLGDGTFSQSPRSLPGGSAGLTRVMMTRAVDFDRDGRQDVVMIGNDRRLLLYLGNGDGTFIDPSSAGQTIATLNSQLSSGSIRDLTLGDINNDGNLDVVITTGGQAIALVPGAGRRFDLGAVPTLQGSPNYLTFASRGAQLLDWNQDGRLDLAWTKITGLQILVGTGNMSFSTTLNAHSTTSSGWWGAYSDAYMEMGDFDNDGKDDLVISHPATGSGRSILYNRSR